jgi:hypothetical protein
MQEGALFVTLPAADSLPRAVLAPEEGGHDPDDDEDRQGDGQDDARHGAAGHDLEEERLEGPDSNGDDEEGQRAREGDAHARVEEVHLLETCAARPVSERAGGCRGGRLYWAAGVPDLRSRRGRG